MRWFLIVPLLLGPVILWGQTPSEEPIEVGILRFFGDEEPINDLFWEAVIQDTGTLDRFTALNVGMTQEEANEFPPDEPPPAKWVGDYRYVLSGALFPDPDVEQMNMQTWLWDMKVPSLVLTDQMVAQDWIGKESFPENREFVTALVEYVFSNVPIEIKYDADLVVPAEDEVSTTVQGEQEDSPPVTQETMSQEDREEMWRNRLLYVNLGLGVDAGQFIYQRNSRFAAGILTPTVMAGIEWHFEDYLALEVDLLRPRSLHNGYDIAVLSLTFPLLIKGVFRPGPLMVEPYLGAAFEFGLIGGAVPPLSAWAGTQLGIKAGQNSSWTLDTGFSLSVLGAFENHNGDPLSLLHIHILMGYKFGFWERRGRAL